MKTSPFSTKANGSFSSGVATMTFDTPKPNHVRFCERLEIGITPPAVTTTLDSGGWAAQVTNPGAGVTITSVSGLTVGVRYAVQVTAAVTTAGAAETDMSFYNGGTQVAQLLAGQQPTVYEFEITALTGSLYIKAGAGSAANTYQAGIIFKVVDPTLSAATEFVATLYEGSVGPENYRDQMSLDYYSELGGVFVWKPRILFSAAAAPVLQVVTNNPLDTGQAYGRLWYYDELLDSAIGPESHKATALHGDKPTLTAADLVHATAVAGELL